MYGQRGGQEDARVAASLAAVKVGLITERQGQLLRRRLEEGLAPKGREGVPPKYDLRVGLGYGVELQGFRRDGFPSRVRFNATATWLLFDVGTPPREITRGSERASDAYDMFGDWPWDRTAALFVATEIRGNIRRLRGVEGMGHLSMYIYYLWAYLLGH